MNQGKWYVLAALIAMGSPLPGWAQNAFDAQGPAPMMGPPAFASDPPPLPAPEFCPTPTHKPVRSAIPFDNLCCPVGNGFSTDCPPEDCNAGSWYLGIGVMALRRTQLDRGVVAVVDPSALTGG